MAKGKSHNQHRLKAKRQTPQRRRRWCPYWIPFGATVLFLLPFFFALISDYKVTTEEVALFQAAAWPIASVFAAFFGVNILRK